MKTMKTVLLEEVNQLEKIVKRAKERLEGAPKGYLRINNKKGRTEYYYKSEEEREKRRKNGRYLKKSEMNLAKAIAQRDYDTRIVECAKARIEAINRFLKKYERNGLAEAYEKTNRQRRLLISPEIIPDNEYIKQWMEVEYTGKPFLDDENEIITERGERVRSKSEKIIADKLYALGIPYRYEYPITLEGNIVIYPDFTILRVSSREEAYLEHFGRMDDPQYVEKTLYKLATYERNGIFLGLNLYVTFETGRKALNSRDLNTLLRSLFCEQ
ncbi:MAG: hypothetical protein E7289_07365 [Lachnospiraceae bacterium]|nr:hypothetical protein [Lachnospiraceae bacterium]